jgi:hypothetical protein
MRKGPLNRTAVLAVGALAAIAAAEPAAAYIGPGAGLGMIASLIAVVGAVVLALVGILFYPMRLLLKRRRKAALAGSKTDAGLPSGPPSGS